MFLNILIFMGNAQKQKMGWRRTIFLVTLATFDYIRFVHGLASCRRNTISPDKGLCKGMTLTNNYCVGESNLFSTAQSNDWIAAKKAQLEGFTKETCTFDITLLCRALSNSSSVVVMNCPSHFSCIISVNVLNSDFFQAGL